MKTKLLYLLLIIPFFSFSQYRLVKDIRSGTNSSSPFNFIEFNNQIYFYTENGGFGTDKRINVSNGTDLNTFVLKDLNENDLFPASQNSNTDWAILNNELFFPAQNIWDGVELYKTNGQSHTAELVKEIAAGGAYANPKDFEVLGNKLLFSANDQINGRELWITDGTTAGTQLLKDIDTAFDGSPKSLFSFNGSIYFTATDITGGTGEELWITDGTTAGTQLLKDIAPGATNSTPRDFIGYNGKVYFTANDGTNGRELWTTDGTAVGTYMIQDLNTVANTGSHPSSLTVFADDLVFAADATGVGVELVKMNPSENITSLGNINPTGDSNPNNLTVLGGKLYFSADNGTTGVELYKTNGFSSGTGIAAEIHPAGSSSPEYLLAYNNKLYFRADDGSFGKELWSYDETNGAVLIHDFNSSGDSNPKPQIVYDNELYFTVDFPSNYGVELWSYIDPDFKTYVPDDAFEQYIIDLGKDNVLDDYVSTGSINSLTTLTISSQYSIVDFTGLEGFKTLKIFSFNYYGGTSLDFSKNTNLQEIVVLNSPNLTSINIQPTTGSPLKSFTLANVPSITSLELSNYTTLETVNIALGNTSLQSVNLSNCNTSNLNVTINNVQTLSSINFAGNSALATLSIFNTPLISQVDFNNALNLNTLLIRNTGVSALDLSSYANLTTVIVDNNQLTSLNVKNGNNNILTTFNASGNVNLSCIEVDNEIDANAGNAVYSSWQKDASATYSQDCASLSVDELNVDNIGLFPNPVKDNFSLQTNNEQVEKIKVFDINGRLVKAFQKEQQYYSISELNNGIYFVSIKLNNGELIKKLIKY